MIVWWLALVVPASASEDLPATEAADPFTLPVTLLDAGRGRKRPLRLAPQEGDTWSLQLVRAPSMTVSTDGAPPTTQAPPTTVQSFALAHEGDYTTVRQVSADVEGVTDDHVAPLLGALYRLGEVPLTVPDHPRHARPLALDEAIEDDPGLADLVTETTWALQTVALPFPEEPVGRGARWRVTLPADEAGEGRVQAAECTLLRRRRDEAVVGVHWTLSGDGAPTEAVDVRALALDGEGTVWWDLRRALPAAARATLRGRLEAAWTDDAGDDHALEGEASLEVRIATR